MKNKEFFAKEIAEAVKGGGGFSVNSKTKKMSGCGDHGTYCTSCLFASKGELNYCSENKLKWCESEYVETYKLTSLEYELLKYYFSFGFKYIVRDGEKQLLMSRNEVYYSVVHGDNITVSDKCGEVFDNNFNMYLDKLFSFIERDRAFLIKSILDNCEIIKGEDDGE